MELQLTKSVTNYLYWIRDCKAEFNYCRAVDLARKIEITPGSCSSWLKKLLKHWVIEEDVNKFISLSKDWVKILKQLDKNKEIFNTFIWAETMLDKSKAEKFTDWFIHLVPQELINAIYL